MASQAPNNNNSSSSLPKDSSLTSNPPRKPPRDFQAWYTAHANDPKPLNRPKVERKPGDVRIGHGGPIRITAQDGIVTEYGKKLQQERLAQWAATKEVAGGKEEQSSS
jgi:hypothetical protein